MTARAARRTAAFMGGNGAVGGAIAVGGTDTEKRSRS